MNIHHIPYANGSQRPHIVAFDQRPPATAFGDEVALLGAILVRNDIYGVVKDSVAVEYFSDALHRRIYAGMSKLIDAGKHVSDITLKSECKLTADEYKYLGSLVANASGYRNVTAYADEVRRAYAVRRLVTACSSAVDDAYAAHAESTPVEDLMRTLEAEIRLVRGETSSAALQVEFRRLSNIDAEPITWLWPLRIACGKIGIIAGEPGVGKSQITCMMASIVSRGGEWPDGSRAPKGTVIIICCEDDAADTLKPRLMAAEADCSKIILCDWIKKDGERRHFDVGQHIQQLSELVRKEGDVRLIVIDPISAYMGKADSHVVAEVRQSLSPVQAMAAELGPAVLMVSHLNKGGNGGGNAISRVSGSGAYVAVSRSAYLVVKDPEDETERRRIMTPLKNNIGDDRTGFSYHLEGWQSGDIIASRVVFDPEPITTLADKLLQRSGGGNADDGSALAEAIEFLRQELDAGPKPSKQVDASARDAGVSSASLKRARKDLGVKARKDGDGRWHLELPNWKAQGAQGEQGEQGNHGG